MKFKYKIHDIVYDKIDKDFYRIDKLDKGLPKEGGYWITMLCELSLPEDWRTSIFHPIHMEHHLNLATEMEVALYARF